MHKPFTHLQVKSVGTSRNWKRPSLSSRLYAGDAGQRKAAVTELLICLQAKDASTQEECDAALDSLWSLQYKTGPGVLCAFAGAAWEHNQPGGTSHTAYFRFTDAKAAESFAQHPKLSEVIDQEVRPVFDRQHRIAFPADVPMDLEAMFRRGPEWETGVEHLLVVEASDHSSEDAALEYITQLSEVATSSLGGALQSSVGKLHQAASDADLSSSGKDAYAVMSRFQYSDQLSKLLELPPWQKMLRGDTTLPVVLLFTTAFTIAAAQKSKNTSSLPRL